MKYKIKETDDPEVFAFWNECTDLKGVKHPMLCFTVHSDCLSVTITEEVRRAGELYVEFEVVKNEN